MIIETGTEMERTNEPLLAAREVVKSYGHVQALRGANFDVWGGEVVGLVGDNGAGKSTLIKIFSEDLGADDGEVYFRGRRISIESAIAARRLGFETVYQDLALAPELDISANLFLGRELTRGGMLGKLGFLDKKEMRVRSHNLLGEIGLDVSDQRGRVSNLSGGQRQGVAIARAVNFAETIIFMDEPTAALGVVQSAKVRDLVRQMRDAGLAVVYISHNLPDIFEITDRIEVLRLGQRVARFRTENTTMEEVVGAITGSIIHDNV